MSKSIRLSKKHGLNPSMGVCFWCGGPTNELILFGKLGKGLDDLEAPKETVIDYEPCQTCRKHWEMGVTIIEVSERPAYKYQQEIQNGIFPTGHWCVLREEAAERIFGDIITERKILLLHNELYDQLGLGGAEHSE